MVQRGGVALFGLAAAFLLGGGRGALAFALTASLLVLLWPLLVRYALARPNARSSHRQPVPQGGGIAILLGTALAVVFTLGAAHPGAGEQRQALQGLAIGAALLAGVGAWDDINPLPPWPKLAVQFIAVGLVLAALPAGWRLTPEWVPLALERGLAAVAGVWFVNLTNFIDGIDWITLANFLPLAGAVVLLGSLGKASHAAFWLAGGLAGALLAFAPPNMPRARLFLGDVGSLPLGLAGAWLLHDVAVHAGLAAALVLPLYPLADATLTVLARLRRGARVWEAHREHAYQRAVDRGVPVQTVVARILLLNTVLALLAIALALLPGLAWALVLPLAALGLTALLLRHLAGKPA
jgi:UDP-N-acetylmuramyl pentapeptide phosphotransferase/UDP-N-acetylglucosamine-1-phosphate transferase